MSLYRSARNSSLRSESPKGGSHIDIAILATINTVFWKIVLFQLFCWFACDKVFFHNLIPLFVVILTEVAGSSFGVPITSFHWTTIIIQIILRHVVKSCTLRYSYRSYIDIDWLSLDSIPNKIDMIDIYIYRRKRVDFTVAALYPQSCC